MKKEREKKGPNIYKTGTRIETEKYFMTCYKDTKNKLYVCLVTISFLSVTKIRYKLFYLQ